jgi:hypothetical protein
VLFSDSAQRHFFLLFLSKFFDQMWYSDPHIIQQQVQSILNINGHCGREGNQGRLQHFGFLWTLFD